MRGYVEIDGINLDKRFGLGLTEYTIGAPEPLIKTIQIPGRPGGLDATLALNGRVNLVKRSIEAKLWTQNVSYEEWERLKSELLPLINGRECRLAFSTDPGWYYRGRYSVNLTKTDEVTGDAVISCTNAFPYKLDSTDETSNFSFNPTDFGGIPRKQDHAIKGTGTVECIGFEYNGSITVYASAPIKLTYKDLTFSLQKGKNYIPELHFSEGINLVIFQGSATVRIEYERGIQ